MSYNDVFDFLYENMRTIKIIINSTKILKKNYGDNNCVSTFNNNVVKKYKIIKKMLRYKITYFIKCHNKCQLMMTLFVSKNLRTIEIINSSIDNVIICKVFNNVFNDDVNIKTIAQQLKYRSYSCDTMNKHTKIIHRLHMDNIFDNCHSHTFFEILLLMRIIYDMYTHEWLTEKALVCRLRCINIHNLTRISYTSFKNELLNKLSSTYLMTNIEFIKKILSIDYEYYDRLSTSSKLNSELTEHIYGYELKNDCPNEKEILQYGPTITSSSKFKYFMNKYKTSKICKFIEESTKQNDDILLYVLSMHGIDLIDISRIFKRDMIDILLLMNDNKLIDENNLMSFIDNNILPNDKFLKYVIHDKPNIDINLMITFNNFKRVSHETKIIGKHIFDSCVICMDNFTCYSDDKLMKFTCCNKLMHKKCADDWKSKIKRYQLKCPMCCTKIIAKNDLYKATHYMNDDDNDDYDNNDFRQYTINHGSWTEFVFPALEWINHANSLGNIRYSN